MMKKPVVNGPEKVGGKPNGAFKMDFTMGPGRKMGPTTCCQGKKVVK